MITDARCHTENTINVIFVSGGKDSLAQWLVAIEENVPYCRFLLIRDMNIHRQ